MNKKFIQELNWAATNEPKQEAAVLISKAYNLSNYRYGTIAMKIANLLAVGGTIHVVNSKSITTITNDDENIIHHFMLEQAEYLLLGKDFEYPYGRQVRGTYAKFLKEEFGDRTTAIDFFKSKAWADEKEAFKYAKFNLLDLLLDPLMEAQEQYILKAFTIKEQKRMSVLRTEYYKAGIKRELFLGDLPNQDVTTPIQPAPQIERKFTEEGPYVSFHGDYISTEADQTEAKIVNAWFYEHEEFRVLTLDEQLSELQDLREWFEKLKQVSRQVGVSGFTQDILDKFERLEQLEVEVGHYLEDVNPEWEGEEDTLKFFYDAIDGEYAI